MVILFKQQVALRRMVLSGVKNGANVPKHNIERILLLLQPLKDVERRFSMLRLKFRDDSILEASLQNPELSEHELAEKLDVSELSIRSVLGDKPKVPLQKS